MNPYRSELSHRRTIQTSQPVEVRAMRRVGKSSAGELAAAVMREEILAGRIAGRVPGTRTLAVQLGVSAPTVEAALKILATAGWVVSGGPRKAYQVAAKRQPGRSKLRGSTGKKLRILIHLDLEQLADTSRILVEKLREQMTTRGWSVDLQVLDFLHAKRPRQSWDREIDVDPQTRIIAIYGGEALARWAAKRKLRILFLGGTTGGLAVSMVAVKSSLIAADALARLTALGHQRIILPLCDRKDSFRLALREVTQQAIESTGGCYVAKYHNPESIYRQPDVIFRILEEAFKTRTPTAFVFIDCDELITALSYFCRIGVRVPDDISLVVLSDSVQLEWFYPSPAHYKFPMRRLVKEMIAWLEDENDEVRRCILPGKFVEGKSIAAPSKECRLY